ncbi:FecR family protein [Flavihumibacter sp. CACIAM 22H1]|uniref:FecR family protein n=1 Tax=Flavihumibacter sp. CACIAM 22H1 TaxID=1812911 RepID=UPI000A6225D3|nr:FecR family protein [Flavihumibacter sp. CACIAM 22H1]
MPTHRLNYLLEQFFQKTISVQETEELNELLSQLDKDTPLEEWMREKWASYVAEASLSDQEADGYFEVISGRVEEGERVKKEEEGGSVEEVKGAVYFLKRYWGRVAAVVVVVASGLLLYLSTQEKASPVPAEQLAKTARQDVAPGGNYATLTLGDGSKLVLDSVGNGLIASQGNARIIKLNNGALSYEKENAADKVVFNTMSTPVGGQYRLTLPDGTGIWLNAASSITYPTAFTGGERTVSITGEVYFEVAKNPRQPFKVKAGDQLIEVLGTHFNVNAYPEERSLATTLVEGSVKVSGIGTGHTENPASAAPVLILQPGQQAQFSKGKLQLNQYPDLEETLAWKDGLFHFNGTNIETIMRNVARWYGVEVVYKDKIDEQFVAEIPRNVNVSQLLELLELTRQVKFSVENKVITVRKGK